MSKPSTTARDRVHELLATAGPAGITLRELGEHVRSAMVHVESLRFEGHGIEVTKGDDERGQPVTRVILHVDAWADPQGRLAA